jgi:hypothetical protein
MTDDQIKKSGPTLPYFQGTEGFLPYHRASVKRFQVSSSRSSRLRFGGVLPRRTGGTGAQAGARKRGSGIRPHRGAAQRRGHSAQNGATVARAAVPVVPLVAGSLELDDEHLSRGLPQIRVRRAHVGCSSSELKQFAVAHVRQACPQLVDVEIGFQCNPGRITVLRKHGCGAAWPGTRTVRTPGSCPTLHAKIRRPYGAYSNACRCPRHIRR